MTSDPTIVKAAAHQIMLKLQLRDFGHLVGGEFRTSVGQTEEFIKACEEAAVNVLTAVTPLITARARAEGEGEGEEVSRLRALATPELPSKVKPDE